ncbi:MAG: hypothetical protein EBU12_09875 [Microbacteriaceae bacterium]|nr:hypothetical protein [Microbacteriaceae bacterium]
MASLTYQDKLKGLKAELDAGNIDETTYDALKKDLISGQYTPEADLGQFETLLGKLEGSKMRQQRQKSVEGRRDIYTQGLAQMMSNF